MSCKRPPVREILLRNSLVVQWLRLFTFTAKGLGSIPGRGTRIWGWAAVPHSILLCVCQVMVVQWEELPGDWEVEDRHRATHDGGQTHRARHAFTLLLLCDPLIVFTAAWVHWTHRGCSPHKAHLALPFMAQLVAMSAGLPAFLKSFNWSPVPDSAGQA